MPPPENVKKRLMTADGQKIPPPFLSSRSQSAPQLLTHVRPPDASALTYIAYQPQPGTYMPQQQQLHHHHHQLHQQAEHAGYILPLIGSHMTEQSDLPVQAPYILSPPHLIETNVTFDELELELCDWTLEDSLSSGQTTTIGGGGAESGGSLLEMPRSPDGMLMSDELKLDDMERRSVNTAHIFGSHSGFLDAQLHL
jgi:hypothetical protein